jgi:hypothetical protein
MPKEHDPAPPHGRGEQLHTAATIRASQTELLRVVARAIRAAGAAIVLANIDALDRHGVTPEDVMGRLRSLAQL